MRWIHPGVLLGLVVLAAAAAGCGPIVIAGPTYTGEMREAVVDATDGWWVPWKVAVIEVEGVITGGDGGGFLARRENTVARFREELRRAEEDFLVRAVLVRINSPGGGVTASDVIYHEIREFRKRSEKPVVVCVMDVGASGAYYLALAGDYIVAHPTAVVGGVGVLVQLFNAEELLGKVGLKSETIKSAQKKDMGSPFRTMTEEERALIKGIVDSLHGRFVRLIASRREGLDENAVRKLADGRVYTAEKARELGLVDQVGYLSDAFRKAKELAHIRRARMVMYHRLLGYKGSAYALGWPEQVNLFNVDLGVDRLLGRGRPLFMYLWTPGM